jgi:hypothetical protein
MTPEDRDVLVAVTPDATNLLATLQGVVKATDALEDPLCRQFAPEDRAVRTRSLGQLRDQLGRQGG